MGMFFNRPKRNFRGETPEEEAAREKVEKARLAQKQAAWRPLRGEELRGAVKTHLEEELEDRLGEKVDYDMNAPLIQYDMDELDIVELILAFEEIFETVF